MRHVAVASSMEVVVSLNSSYLSLVSDSDNGGVCKQYNAASRLMSVFGLLAALQDTGYARLVAADSPPLHLYRERISDGGLLQY